MTISTGQLEQQGLHLIFGAEDSWRKVLQVEAFVLGQSSPDETGLADTVTNQHDFPSHLDEKISFPSVTTTLRYWTLLIN